MNEDIINLFEISKKNFDNLILNFNLNDFDSSNLFNANVEIKHILEDLRSIYDYIMVHINDLYCHNEGKIFFPYAKKNVNQEEFTEKRSKDFLNIPQNIINLIIDVQYFKSNKEWLLNLMNLTNDVKHIRLSINKIRVEKETTYTDGATEMITTGDLEIIPYSNGNGFYVTGVGNVFVSGEEQVNFFENGIIYVGNGTIDINDPSKTDLNIKYVENNVLQFELIEKDVYDILKEIIDETELFLLKILKEF